MLNELAKRKPNFDEKNSVGIVLADHQTWFLPKPWLEIKPTFRNVRVEFAYPVLTCGRDLDELVEAIGESDEPVACVVAVASLGANLLTRNYELTDDNLDELFSFRTGDETSTQWLRQVIAVATGNSAPKASSAGCD